MKTIEMKKTVCGSDGWKENGSATFVRVSRWITVQQNYNPKKRNSLSYYIQDGYGYKMDDSRYNPKENGGPYLDYFRWNGRTWAVEQFLCLNNPFWCPVGYSWEDKEGKLHYLSGYDSENYYNPIYVEFDECCERVRVYELVEEGV